MAGARYEHYPTICPARTMMECQLVLTAMTTLLPNTSEEVFPGFCQNRRRNVIRTGIGVLGLPDLDHVIDLDHLSIELNPKLDSPAPPIIMTRIESVASK